MRGKSVQFLLFIAAMLLPAAGWAQAYPTRPVCIVVGFGAGAPDTTARIAGEIQVMLVTTTLGLPHIRVKRMGEIVRIAGVEAQ